jgi:hypothetical protein
VILSGHNKGIDDFQFLESDGTWTWRIKKSFFSMAILDPIDPGHAYSK